MKIKVLVAEDHTLVAKLIVQLIGSHNDISVVACVGDGQSVIDMLAIKQIDVILMDIDMPVLDGISTTKLIRTTNPKVKIIMLTNHIEAPLIKKALMTGANGYLSKFADSDEVISAIKTVFNGSNYYCKTTILSVMTNINKLESEDKNKTAYNSLSPREKEVLELVTLEMTTKEVSEKLFLSKRTVETHRRNIMKKLGVKNATGLVKISMEQHLLEELKSD